LNPPGHTDLEATERFYTDFGLTVAYRIENEIGFRPALARGYCYVACKASKPVLIHQHN
jgi:catechol 2,3-dioxygenase-like lactoylglutathione lyase family enzyme